MNTRFDGDSGLILAGIDGGNPLAFLAALGTFRTLSDALPDHEVRMGWVEHAGAWRPMLRGDRPLTRDETVDHLHTHLQRMIDHPAFAFADDLNITRARFRAFAVSAVESAHQTNPARDQTAAGFAAAFACDALASNRGVIQNTGLRTMSGAGHQYFLEFMRKIVEQTTAHHLYKTLFAAWKYDDPVAKQTLRWDPADDSRYALQWRDPSNDPTRKSGGGMLGANRLAIEGLPLVSSAPVGTVLRTTGFTGSRASNTFWTWPIWAPPVSLDVCRGLLAHPSLVSADPTEAAMLRARGVMAAYRSQRITVGQYRNFAPAALVF